MAKVSIIMPTYNRADSIRRAIVSAQAQTFTDWELLIVDDGSTDDTAALIPRDEPRIRVIRQENGGFVAARNRGLREATSEYVAFLDSDDELKPFHIELGLAFLEAHPQAQFVTGEGQEDFGHGRYRFHYRIEMSEWYPSKAQSIGSRSFDLPPGETDHYLRAYSAREPVGAWGAHILAKAGISEPVYVYSGRVFEHLRWGFIVSVNSMVARRATLQAMGFLNPKYGLAADQHLVSQLASKYDTYFIGLPVYFKHEYTAAGDIPTESHLVTGKSALRFYNDMLLTYDDWFSRPRPDDPEIKAIRSLMLMDNAQIALKAGLRREALEFLEQARAARPQLPRAGTLQWLARLAPNPRLAERIWRRGYETLDRLSVRKPK